MLLGDQGADVIKVETRGRGDHVCAATNQQGGFSASFLNNNRNRRSVTLDLKAPEGREAPCRLAAGVDVLAQNFRATVVERLQITEKDPRTGCCLPMGAQLMGRQHQDVTMTAWAGWILGNFPPVVLT